jgi:hypothetical protein
MKVDVEFYKCNSTGGSATLLGTTNIDTESMSSGVIKEFFTDLFIPQTAMLSTDRLYCQIYVDVKLSVTTPGTISSGP